MVILGVAELQEETLYMYIMWTPEPRWVRLVYAVGQYNLLGEYT